jgi:hypothetical protein
MTYRGSDSKRKTWPGGLPKSLAGWAGTLFETLGLLNKGSARAQAVPDASDAAKTGQISSNTLNVTRVGGITTLIGAAGSAALLILNVNKTADRAPIVVAAYLSIGAIVATALLTVAIIIAADVRARTAVAAAATPATQPSPQPQPGHQGQPAPGGVTRVIAPGLTSLTRVFDYVLVSATAGSMELVLPSAGSVPWQQMTIKREDPDASHTVALRPQAQQTITGQPQRQLPPSGSVQLYSDGLNWLAV